MLVQHTIRKIKAGGLGARELANVAHGAACSGQGSSMTMLFAAVASAAERRVGEVNAQNLANTLWTFAKVAMQEEGLMRSVSSRTLGLLEEFSNRALMLR